ncbi:MAG: carboxylating nicotinate-nucleotide diphosphorylase [Candidatus Gracilibacteria bacterium]|nr:carboxylating nicotinate-nucleotide diphosphorylase [bacterium]MDZ4216805.1 carboxylating nicotinate-nucleotide diphosphorylase [Candidatus Gracilibacteria bacterium]
MNLEQELKALILLATAEDGATDVTSQTLFDDDVLKEGVIIAKQNGVLCGLKFLQQIAQAIDEELVVDPFLDEGDNVKERMMIASITGKAASLLRAERILLNFLGRLSGIATMTRQFVQCVDAHGGVILDTRKTVPGWRYLDKYAVKIGGGVNHRMNLEEVAIIKDTHVDGMGGISAAIVRFREKNKDTPLIVEVRDLKELQEALGYAKSLNRIILDNFTLDLMTEAVELASQKILLEASGGVTLENAEQIAETGVHFLSVGALTHSSKIFDWSFRLS